MNSPVKINAAHILVKTDSQAHVLKEQLNNGADFAALARANSTCPSSKDGGNLGFFGRGQMVKQFEDAAYATPIGEISDVVQTQFGYHLIKRLY